jgi:hypothetical protein
VQSSGKTKVPRQQVENLERKKTKHALSTSFERIQALQRCAANCEGPAQIKEAEPFKIQLYLLEQRTSFK